MGVTLTSLRVTIDQHLSHWYTQFKSIAPTMKGDGQTTPSRPHPFLPSVSIVLSAELSDCLVTTEVCLVGVAKECQLVSASSALRATLSTTDHTHNRSARYKIISIYKPAVINYYYSVYHIEWLIHTSMYLWWAGSVTTHHCCLATNCIIRGVCFLLAALLLMWPHPLCVVATLILTLN